MDFPSREIAIRSAAAARGVGEGLMSRFGPVAAVALLCLLPQRGEAFEGAIDPAAPPPRASAVPVPPERIDAAIARLDELAADLLRKAGIPGLSVAVVRDGRAVYVKGFGLRKAGEAGVVDADTVFQLASVSKPVAASVVAAQVGRGVVRWDSPVAKLLPWFALSDPWVTKQVTVGDLFAHRSGLPDHGGDMLEQLDYERPDILRRLRHLPLAPFRAHYAYTNFGLTAGAEAVAAASGRDWATLSEEAIYRPLGMTRTSSRFEDFEERDNRAVNHVMVEGSYQPRFQRKPDAQSPAGGVSSSPHDMARWMAMVLAGRMARGRPVVEGAARLGGLRPQMLSAPPQTAADRGGFYGFGMGVGVTPSGRVMLSHSGGFALGAATYLQLIPSLDLGIVVLSNAAPTGAVEALGAEFADLAQFGSVTRDWYAAYAGLYAPMSRPFGSLVGKEPPARPKPPADDDAYLGFYANAYFGDAVIARKGGNLILVMGNEGAKVYPLRHWDGDTFVFAPEGEDPPPGSLSRLDFQRAKGKASALRIEYFAEDLTRGLFKRE